MVRGRNRCFVLRGIVSMKQELSEARGNEAYPVEIEIMLFNYTLSVTNLSKAQASSD